jgi:hypothetical protein
VEDAETLAELAMLLPNLIAALEHSSRHCMIVADALAKTQSTIAHL